jgi:hypothetical protein
VHDEHDSSGTSGAPAAADRRGRGLRCRSRVLPRCLLGLTEQAAFEGEGDARVAILEAGRATLEIANPAQKRMIDEIEVGRPTSRTIRVAFEVDDSVTKTRELVAAGATLIAPPTETPWKSLNSRLEAPAGLQITLFQELESLEDRTRRASFGTADGRNEVP